MQGANGVLLLVAVLMVPLFCGATHGGGLSEMVGRQAVIEGKISNIPWQHLIHIPKEGQQPVYVDIIGTSLQTVAYVGGSIACRSHVLLEGTVLGVTGGPKRPGEGGATHTEYQLKVDRWRCTDPEKVEALLNELADGSRSTEEKQKIERRIVMLGREAVETLIAHLADTRLYDMRKVIANENLMLNAPPGQKPVAPDVHELKINVGTRCAALLSRIFTPPDYRSPHESRHKPAETGGDWYFRVKDWVRWWAGHRYLPLAEIREGMKPVIDAYWISHGVEQVVE
jgi:hypothetical protein